MSKPKAERRVDTHQARAVINMLRVSPRKLNLLAQMIRGMDAGAALVQLQFSEKRIATAVQKGLQAAIANAENNHNLDIDRLVVEEAWVGKALVMKRMHTRGRGRSARIRKPFSQMTIVLSEVKEGE